MKPSYVASPALAQIVGRSPMSLDEICGRFWAYVTASGQWNPIRNRLTPDDRVASVIGRDVGFVSPGETGELAQRLARHLRST